MAERKDDVLLAEEDAKSRIQLVLQEKDDLLRKAKEQAKQNLRSHDEELQQLTQDKITHLYIDRSNIDEIEKHTQTEVQRLEESFHKNKDKVVDFLFESVTNIKIVIPDVVIADFEKSKKFQ